MRQNKGGADWRRKEKGESEKSKGRRREKRERRQEKWTADRRRTK
jgi:hypothetical protein